MGPISAGEMRKGDPYEGENFDVTDWGCLEEGGDTAPPHASPGRRSSGTIDCLKAYSDEERSRLEVSLDSVCCIPSRL